MFSLLCTFNVFYVLSTWLYRGLDSCQIQIEGAFVKKKNYEHNLVTSLQKVLNAEQAKITFFGQTVNYKPTILNWFMVCLERKKYIPSKKLSTKMQ
jgi:hypothetical protein